MSEDLFPVSIQEQIACVEREIAMRERVYPRRVADGKMKQEAADKEMRRMRAVLETLRMWPALKAEVATKDAALDCLGRQYKDRLDQVHELRAENATLTDRYDSLLRDAQASEKAWDESRDEP